MSFNKRKNDSGSSWSRNDSNSRGGDSWSRRDSNNRGGDSWSRRDSNNRGDSYNRNDSYNNRSSSNNRNDSYNKKDNYDNWSSTNFSYPTLEPFKFEKNFYTPKNTMSEKETEKFREEHKMTLKGQNIPNPVRNFSDIELFNSYTRLRNYSSPTPIQSQGWPMALSGRDMVGIAQTGSGKTLSFVLPALIHANDQIKQKLPRGPIILILAPTRELVLQITEVVNEYKGNLSSVAIYGGVSSFSQKQALRSGAEILIATPGRLIDLFDQGCVNLQRVTFLVLDEADRMLDMGFEPQLKRIIPKTHSERQTLMWSATWPREVRNLAMDYMNDYIQVNIGEDELTVNKRIEQKVLVTENREKKKILLNELNNTFNDKSENKKRKVIIFCNTKRMCDDLDFYLRDQNYKSTAIHGDKSQNVRDRVINDFKDGYKTILIATDVAARGLDVKDVDLVLNYDFPKQCEDYVHRIGRTGRGGKKGKSVSFFTYEDRNNAKKLIEILQDAGSDIDRELKDMVVSKSGERKYFRRW